MGCEGNTRTTGRLSCRVQCLRMLVLRTIKRSSALLSCLARTLAAMEAAAVAALAAIVDHDHARALNELLQESIQLRQQLQQQGQQLEQQGQQLEQQWQQLEQQHNQLYRQRLQITQLEIVMSMTRHDVKTGDIASAMERLGDYCDDSDGDSPRLA